MSRRQDIQDATGRVEYLAGRGTLQAWGTAAPTNGVTGFAPGCQWQDIKNGKVYVNSGVGASFTNAQWVEDDGTSGAGNLFGGGTALALGSGNIYRNVFGPAGSSPALTAADIVVDVYSLPANSFDGTGFRGLSITAAGNFAANVNAKVPKIFIGCTTAVIGSAVTGGTAIATGTTGNGVGWFLNSQVFKYGAANSNTQIWQETATVTGTAHGGMSTAAALTMTENAAILIAVTMNCTTTNTDGTLWWWEVSAFN